MRNAVVGRSFRLVILTLFALACGFVFFQIVSVNLPGILFPDEITGFNIFRRYHGYIGTVTYYWSDLIARYAAIAWFGLPLVLTPASLATPWETVVLARAFNWVVVLICLAGLFRTVFPRLPFLFWLGFAALFLAATVVPTGVLGLTHYWLLDESIYLFSFSAYCLVLLCFWRVLRDGVNKNAWWLLLALFLAIGTHEVMLVAGGLMMAFFFIVLLKSYHQGAVGQIPHNVLTAVRGLIRARSRIDKRRVVQENFTRSRHNFELSLMLHLGSRRLASVATGFTRSALYLSIGQLFCSIRLAIRRDWSLLAIRLGRIRLLSQLRHGTLQQRMLLLFLAMSALYIVGAGLQLLSPSIIFRFKVWPIQLSLIEAAKIGVPLAFVPLYEIAFGLKGALPPIILCGILAGFLQPPLPAASDARRWLLLCPLLFALVTVCIMVTLTAQINLLGGTSFYVDLKIPISDEKYLPSRQVFLAHQLWFLGFFFLGVFLGSWAASLAVFRTSWQKKWVPLMMGCCAVWLAYGVVTAPGFASAREFDWYAKLLSMNARMRPLSENPGFDKRRYIEEMPRAYVEWSGPPLGSYPFESELQRMFKVDAIVFVPCTLDGKQDECTIKNLPQLERILDGGKEGLSKIWSAAVGGSASMQGDAMVFAEDASSGNHLLSTAPLAKSDRAVVQIAMTIEVPALGDREAVLSVVSQDGQAWAKFDLSSMKTDGRSESKMFALDGRVRRLSPSTFELTARFVVTGASDRFSVRLEGVKAGQVSYTGDARAAWKISNTRIRLFDSGTAVSRLAGKAGASRVFASDQ